jgi:hypothetical protein
MLRRIAFGICLLSATVLSPAASAKDDRTLQIIVSKDRQMLTVYDGDMVVATSRVSTGKEGHTTPSGIFSILEKRKYHESNIYSDAPMPYMQRLTWSGIALHESSSVPSYPASHGCIRMPGVFAKSLYKMTGRGMHVIVSDASVTPMRIEHPALFRPRPSFPDGALLSDLQLRPTSLGTASKPVEVAMHVMPPSPDRAKPDVDKKDAGPLRILIHRRGEKEILRDVQALLTDLGFDAGTPDGVAGPKTRSAIAGFKRWKDLSQKSPMLSTEFVEALYKSAGKPQPPLGQLSVRQGFKPLFEAPVDIRQPELALGTHFLLADHVERETGKAEWRAVTLANHMSKRTMRRLGITTEADPHAPEAAQRALDRIDIPADLRERIEGLLNDGTSLTITDDGYSPETGKGTDFITITQPEPRPAYDPRSVRRTGKKTG